MVACNADRPQVVYIRDRMTKKERNEKKNVYNKIIFINYTAI